MKRVVSLLLIVSLLAGLLCFGVSAADAVTLQVTGMKNYDYAQEVVRLVNEERAKVGLSPLRMNTVLLDAAMLRAAETSCVFDHSRPDGTRCFGAINDVLPEGQNYWAWGYGENIAAGQTTPTEVVDSWMNSEGHRANILERAFTDIGTGCFVNDHIYHWTLMFTASPADGTAPDASNLRGTESYAPSFPINVEENAIVPSESELTVSPNGTAQCTIHYQNASYAWMKATILPYDADETVKDSASGAAIATVAVDETGTITLTAVSEGSGVLHLYPYAGAAPVALNVRVAKDAHVHTLMLYTIYPPTCTEEGYSVYYCPCGEFFEKDYVAALDHDYRDGVCTRCGAEKPAFNVGLPVHTHSYLGVTTEPSCTTEGYTTYTCACGSTYTDDYTDALGHSYRDGVCIRCGQRKADVPTADFRDVSANAWYKAAVEYAVANGLMNGVGSGKFEPDTATTRAMLVTVLWRYAGSPTDGANDFKDVPNGKWFTQAVAWAAKNGIVTGVGSGKFDPDGTLTREQLATILFRYAKLQGKLSPSRAGFSKFEDGKRVQSWAKEAMQWAVAEEIIGGTGMSGKLYLDPQGNATRAQVATILMRFIENVLK